MAQYIDKAAIVTDIKKYISNYKGILNKVDKSSDEWVDSTLMLESKIDVLQHILSFIDTLEVKKEPVSEDLEEAARRIATRHSHITGDTYYANDAWFFKKGAQWQKKKMIDKACEFLKSYRQDTPDGIGYIAGIIDDKTIEEFKQAMKE